MPFNRPTLQCAQFVGGGGKIFWQFKSYGKYEIERLM